MASTRLPRVALQPYLGKKIQVEGIIGDRGKHTTEWANHTGIHFNTVEKVCLEKVLDLNGKELTDHVWVTETEKMKSLHLERGSRIRLSGWVYEYTKNDSAKTIDLGLQKPSAIEVLSRPGDSDE